MEGTMSETIWLVLNEMRLEGKLCDVVITVDDVEFSAHKVVLSACSEYLRVLFTGDCAQPEKRIYTIPGVSAYIMGLLVEYAYTCSINVTMENVKELLVTADYLSMLDLVQVCSDFLQNHLSPRNCIGIWRFSDICSCPVLKRKVYLYILQHFEEIVCISEEFLELTLQQLATVIEEDKLNVKQESVVFETILRWINHRTQERRDHMALLLPKIRLGLMTEGCLNRVQNKLLMDSIECKPMVSDALKAMHDFNLIEPSNLGPSNLLTRPRLPCAILLAIGGLSGDNPINSIEAYDIRADRWVNVINEDNCPMGGHGVAFLNGFVYCIGGFNGVDYFSSVRKFDLVTRTWHQAAPMYLARSSVSIAVLDGCIYAMGGNDGHNVQKTAERYEPEANQWTLITNMHEHRSNSNATTLQGRVYICGGLHRSEHLLSAEYYNPATNQWTLTNPMTSKRSDLGVVAYGGYVYAIGGFDGVNHLCSAEAYNPVDDTWCAVCPMSTPRRIFGLEVMEDLLFVVGGFNGITNTSKMECFNEKTNKWTDADDMGISRSALSCCVVYDLPNMEDYAAPRDGIPHRQ